MTQLEPSTRRFLLPETACPARRHVIPPKVVGVVGTGIGYSVAAILSPIILVFSIGLGFLLVLGSYMVTLAFPVLAVLCLLKLFS